MPDRMHILDTGFPNFTGYESTEDKLDAIRNYLYLLIEELRYLLRHLDAGNFTESGLAELAEAAAEVTGGSVTGPALTEERLMEALYAAWGITAALSVWRLRTDWRRAWNCLRGDRSDLTYIDIHDDEIDLITERVAEPVRTEQLRRDGAYCWWTDETKGRIGTEETPWPVMVYVYEEVSRAVIRLNGGELTLRRGDAEISMEEYVDARHRRLAYCAVDRRGGSVEYRVEGSENSFFLTLTEEADRAVFTWPDGHSCEVKML